MAQAKCFWGFSRVAERIQFARPWGRGLAPPSLFVPSRGKKVDLKQQKLKKATKAQEMKDFIQRKEMQRMLLAHAIKVARTGEPLEPEILNPARKRSLTDLSKEQKTRRILLDKEWKKMCMEKHLKDVQLLQEMVKSRKKAMAELKSVSWTLYSKAMELQSDLFPLNLKGPTETPAIADYVPPDPDDE